MADEPISGLTETTSVTGNEFIPIVQSGVTKKIKQINLVPNQASFSGTILFDSDITLSSGYIYLEKNTNSGSRSLTIPSATGNTGKFIFVAKQYNNGYNIVCSGGGISSTLTRSNDSVLYICDGSSWQPHLNISNELLLAISGKEPTITAGTTSQYWRGDKTWQTFPTISTPSLDEVTDVGNTTTNDITVGGLVVNMPSGSGVATSITKGGAGEALTVNKTSGSGNVASFTGGVTSLQDAEITSATANRPAFFDSAKKLVIATGALLGTWFQTFTAKSTPIGADTIIVNDSASSFEAKKTTLTELWTNYLRAFIFGATLSTNRVPKSNGSGVLIDSGIFDGGDINGVSFYKTANNSLSIGSPTGQVAIGKFIPVENFGGNFLGDLILIGNNRTHRSHTANSNVVNLINIISDAIFTQNRFEEYRSSTDSESPLLDRHITYRKVFTLATNQWTIDNSALNILQLTSTGVIFRNQFYTTTGQRVSEYNENCNTSCVVEFKSSNAGVGLPLVANGSKPTGKKGNFLMNDTNSVLEFTTGTGANWQELAVYKFDELLQITDCNATFSTANTGVYFPFVPKCDMNVTKIFYNLQSAGTDTVRVAIYSDSSNQATTLLVQGSESTTGATTTGQRSITIASTRLLSGTRYWIAIKNDSGVASFLSKNNVYSNNITREGFTSGAFVTTPAPSSSTNAVWLGIGI